MIDFHSHLVPGVDDGSETLEQSLEALGKMWAQGIRCVITTPHFRASTLNNPAEFVSRITEIDAAWDNFHRAAKEAYPEMRVERGVELALDEPIRAMPDVRVRLAGTEFMLVEFPWFAIPPNSGHALMQLRQLGVIPIVAHPERYDDIGEKWEVLAEWKRCGAFLQLNAGSLVGAYGGRIEAKGWRVLEGGLADYISSDYHARGEPLTAAARERMGARRGDSQFRMLSQLNGERLLSGSPPSPIERLERKEPKWRRLKKALKRTK
jgi:protein-tyrosine phosphatase